MGIQIDFTGASDGGYEALEEGTYDAKVSAVKYHAKAKSSGKPYVEFEFTLEGEGVNNRKLWRNYSLQPNALWALKETLQRLGVEVPDGEFELDESEIVGQPCTLEVEQKPHWQDADKLDNEIVAVKGPSAAAAGGW